MDVFKGEIVIRDGLKIVILLLLLSSMLVACNGKRVEGNTYNGLGQYAVDIDPEFSYVRGLKYFRNYYN